MNPEILRDLRDALADLYADESSIRRIISDAGIHSTRRIALNSSPTNNWHGILVEAQNLGQIDALLTAVAREYSSNSAFSQAYDAYRFASTQRPAQPGMRENDRQRRISHSILPWLVDRSEQMDQLGLALRQLQAQPGRPMVCLLYGDDQECHDKFVDRLKEVELIDLEPDLRTKGPIRRITLDWPTHTKSVSELHDKLTIRLAKEVQDIQADLAEINTHLSASPVLVETYLLIQEWPAKMPEQIKGFVEFWQKWPSLAPGQYLIVCLCLKCMKPKNSFWAFWRRNSSEDLINAMNRTLSDRSHFAFDPYDRVLCSVLSRLQAVSFQAAHNWPLVKYVKLSCPGRDLLEELKRIFDNYPAPAIPMRELGHRLGELLAVSGPGQEIEQ